MTVSFLDLEAQHRPLREKILTAWAAIYDSARFVSGDHVAAFERAFGSAHEVEHTIAVSNGTSALELALRGLGIGAGDRVVVPANTFIATAEAVSNVGAEPIFVDCDTATRNIAVDPVIGAMDKPSIRSVIAMHLYGRPADTSHHRRHAPAWPLRHRRRCPSSCRGPGADWLAGAEANAARLLSLPVFPETTGDQAARVAATLRSAVGKTELERT